MIHNWFECKIRYEKTAENGMVKKVTEPYLVDAFSFTEAEARIIENITPFISGEFMVTAIKRVNYSELFPSETAERWYSARLAFVTLDEKTAAEKETFTTVLVAADNMDEAMKSLEEWMKGTMADYRSLVLRETDIMDVFPYVADKE